MLRTLLVALLLACTFDLAPETSFAQSPQNPKSTTPLVKRFTHEDHVSKSWSAQSGVEVLRDCRGCHDYRGREAGAKIDKPTDRCANCHDPDGYWKEHGQTFVTDNSRVDPAHEEQRLFKHRQHQLDENKKPLACAFCHFEANPTGSKVPWTIKPPTDFLENRSYCTSCHSNPKPAEQWTSEEHAKRKLFNTGLTQDAKRRAGSDGSSARLVFSHAAHLRPEELASGKIEKCAQCHASMKDASPDSMAETQFDTHSCSACHDGLDFKSSSQTEDGQRYTVVSPTAGVFSHAQHLGAPKGVAGVKPIGPEGCLRCHEFETSPTRRAGDGVRSFTLKPFLRREDGKAFQGCIVCHETVAIPDHGNVDTCAQCHAVGAGSLTTQSAMKSNRPVESVERARAASFTFERQSHKFIAKGQTDNAPESCAACHKAKLEEQPSRINGAAFSHATHLNMSAGAATSGDCGQCHGGVAKSRSLTDVELAYEPSACVACHGRTPPTPIVEKSPPAPTLRFDHRQHVGKGGRDGKLLACATCHAPVSTDPGAKIGLNDKVAECSLCHAHSDKPDNRINRFSKSMVDSCKACHAAGVPAKGQPVSVGRERLIVARAGFQEHQGEASCEKCHIITKQPFEGTLRRKSESKPIEVAISAGTGMPESPHEARLALSKLPKGTPDQLATVQYFYDAVSCIDCHFNSVRTALVKDAYVEMARKGAAANERVRKILSNAHWRDDYRKHEFEGDNLGGPGTDYPTGFPGLDPDRKR